MDSNYVMISFNYIVKEIFFGFNNVVFSHCGIKVSSSGCGWSIISRTTFKAEYHAFGIKERPCP